MRRLTVPLYYAFTFSAISIVRFVCFLSDAFISFFNPFYNFVLKSLYGYRPEANIASSEYPGGTMIAPQCIMTVYNESNVASCPPCMFCAEDIALTTLLTVFPDPQSPPCSSMNCFICAAMTPNLVGALQIIASAHSKSSEEATGTSFVSSTCLRQA